MSTLPTKRTLQVSMNPRLGGREERITVEAYAVAGATGVFACWQGGDGLVHMAGGDDGNWWEIARFHPRWVPDIVTALDFLGKKDAPDADPPRAALECNPVKAAAEIAIHHRRLMEAMTQQGPADIAEALNNLEHMLQKARADLGL